MPDLVWYQLVLIPAIMAALPQLWNALQWVLTRGERKDAVKMTADEKRNAANAAERVALSAEMRELIDRIEHERDRANSLIDQYRDRLRVLEADRDRAYDLARHFFRLSRDMQHALNNTRMIVETLCARLIPPEQTPTWELFEVAKSLEDAIPKDLPK